MHLFQAFYNFNGIVFDVEVDVRYRKIQHIYQKDYFLLNYFARIGGDILNYFPINEDELSLVKFIAKYQYLNVKDAKYFFNSNRYYRNRIKNLIDKKFLRKIKWTLVLGQSGIQYAELLKFEYNKLNKNQKYRERLLNLSNIGAFYHNCNTVSFIPSFAIKDKTVFTTTGRRFIGVFNINGFEYLTYQILKEHDNKYIESVIYDIQKEMKYGNFIILVNDINKINLDDFVFGKNQILLIEDNDFNREKLKYLHSVKWKELIDEYYNGVYLSERIFCEYSNNKDKYISTFYFIDTEKINRIKYFIKENPTKTAHIVCDAELEQTLRKQLPNANYCVVDLEKYIDKEIRDYYDQFTNNTLKVKLELTKNMKEYADSVMSCYQTDSEDDPYGDLDDGYRQGYMNYKNIYDDINSEFYYIKVDNKIVGTT